MEQNELESEFHEFAALAARFTRRVVEIRNAGEEQKSKLSESNLEIARTIFGKWCIEIFVILYNEGSLGFEQLRRDIGRITPRVLSEKLKMMEGQGLIRRTTTNSKPPGVRYSLTESGATLARLGEPVFIYLDFRRTARRTNQGPDISATLSEFVYNATERGATP